MGSSRGCDSLNCMPSHISHRRREYHDVGGPIHCILDMSLTHTLLLLAGVAGDNCCDWLTSMGRTARPMETSFWLRCMEGLLRAVYCCTCSSVRPHKAARARSMLKRAYTAAAQFVMLYVSQLSAIRKHALVSSSMHAHIHSNMEGDDPSACMPQAHKANNLSCNM